MIFGIPKEINEEDIKEIFTKKETFPISMEWKTYNGMEYLLC